MKKHQFLRYGLLRRFRRGVRLSIALTYRCNLNCSYCSTKIATGKTPTAKEVSWHELVSFVSRFPYPIREIRLTGGAPELHKYFVGFVNWLLDKGYFVQVITNLLFYDKLNKLKRTPRLMFCATYHHEMGVIEKIEWFANYGRLKENYRIIVDEIDYQVLPSISRLKPFLTKEVMKSNDNMLRVGPDLEIYLNCFNRHANKHI